MALVLAMALAMAMAMALALAMAQAMVQALVLAMALALAMAIMGGEMKAYYCIADSVHDEIKRLAGSAAEIYGFTAYQQIVVECLMYRAAFAVLLDAEAPIAGKDSNCEDS